MAEEEKESLSLPFSEAKQQAILAYLLTDPNFFSVAKTRIKRDWFADPRCGQVWGLALEFYERFGRGPTPSEISDYHGMTILDVAEQNRLRATINLSLQRREDYGLDAIRPELTDWLHAQIYITGMKRSEKYFNAASRGDYSKYQLAYAELDRMKREIDDVDFEPGQVEPMDDPRADFEQEQVDIKNALTLGLPALDRLLLPDGDGKGSLLKGCMTVLLSPTNGGKTTAMVTILVNNILQGKDVLFITHEGRVPDIKLKIWECLMGMNRRDVMAALGNPEFDKVLAICRQLVKDHLEFVPMNQAGLEVEEVEAMIRRRQDRWMSRHNGKPFDLIIDDYAAKLTTQKARGGQFALRQIHEVVYNYFSQIALAKGQECHVITAIQTNREGSRVNRNGANKKEKSRLLVLEDVMESWGPMTTATNVITLNRDEYAQAHDLSTWYICKSRSSAVGWAVVCQSDFNCARSHLKDGKCTWYRSSSSMADKIDSILDSNNGHEVPWEEIMGIERQQGYR